MALNLTKGVDCLILPIIFLLRRFFKISGWILLGLILLITLLYGVLQIRSVQTWVAGKAAHTLSARLGTEVSISGIDLRFFDKLELKNLLIRDKQKDTLLFAGTLAVTITDWFFLKDKYTLHYIGLEDSYVNLSRTDSVWNYRFLADYFTDTSAPKGKNPEINLEKLEIKNLRFAQRDGWVGQDLITGIGSLDLSVRNLSPSKKQLHIESLRMSGASFWQYEYAGNKPRGYPSAPVSPAPQGPYRWNPDNWVVQADIIQLIDGSLRIDKETEHAPYEDRFDGQHFTFKGLSANIGNLVFSKDTLSASILLSGKEKSGFEVKKLQADLHFDPTIMEFKNLDLVTNTSRLRDYYAMHYHSFIDDMNDFVDKVTLEGRFMDGELSSEDLAYFDPRIKSWNRNFQFSGKAKGTIGNMRATGISVRSGQSSLNGNLQLKNMTDLDSLHMELEDGTIHTSFREIAQMMPSVKDMPGLHPESLGIISYKGNLSGNISHFRADGLLATDLGSLSGNVIMDFPQKSVPFYEGQLSSSGIRPGKFLGNENMGNIAFSGHFKGQGFSGEEFRLDLSADIQSLGINDYDYKNIIVDGRIAGEEFAGKLSVDDPNIRITDLAGRFGFAENKLSAGAKGHIDNLNLRGLGLYDRDVSLSGEVNFNFSGSSAEELTGEAIIKELRFVNQNDSILISQWKISTGQDDGERFLSFESPVASGSIAGTFSYPDIPSGFTYFLSRYYPSLVKPPAGSLEGRQFRFNIRTGECSKLLSMFLPDASGLEYATVTGNVNPGKNELRLSGEIPSLIFRKNELDDIQFAGIGSGDSLNMSVSVDDIAISDSLHFPGTRLEFSSRNDLSQIFMKTKATETLSDAELNARLQTFSDGIRLSFSPSAFIINNKKWVLEKDGELTIRKNNFEARDIRFTQGYQEISLSSRKKSDTSASLLTANFRSVNLEDFAPMFFTDPELRGLLSGTAEIRQPLDRAGIRFSGKADSLYINKSMIGSVNLAADADLEKGKINFSGSSDNRDYQFKLDGKYDLKDSTGNRMDTRFTGDRIDLAVLAPYLSSVFSDLSGSAQGNLRMFSEGNDTYLTGTVDVDSGALEVGYTRCRYQLKNQEVIFNRNEIVAKKVELKDDLGNRGILSGLIRHKLFSDFSFDNLKFESPRMMLLNTTEEDNDQFYGNVIGGAVMTLNGPLADMKMTIDGSPSQTDSSHLYLQTGDSRESSAVDYIDFVQFGSLARTEGWSSEEANIILDMNIDANPACKVDVILDKATGDVIKGTGKGLIGIRVGNREPLAVRGRYELSSGEYTFNFQTFLKKPFTLKRGNILWTGDPYEAVIDIDAEYIARNVNVSNLMPTEGFRQREDIIILSHLKGNLTKPAITFEFKLPEKSELSRDYLAVKKLADIQNDENEMNKQVASLLLFNSFLTENQNFFSQQNTMAFAASTVGGILSNWLTNLFNKELGRATNGMISTYIDINPTLSLQNNANELQANVRAGLKLLLSNRLVFLVGGTLDYNNPYFQLEQKGLLTPDITLEWLLNKEGSVRVVGFHRSSIDYSMGQRNRSGAQLSYRKDFDRLEDMFKSRKKIEEDAVKSELKGQ